MYSTQTKLGRPAAATRKHVQPHARSPPTQPGHSATSSLSSDYMTLCIQPFRRRTCEGFCPLSRMGIPPMPPSAKARLPGPPSGGAAFLYFRSQLASDRCPFSLPLRPIVYVSTHGFHGNLQGTRAPVVTSSPVRFGFRSSSDALLGPHDRFGNDPWLPQANWRI